MIKELVSVGIFLIMTASAVAAVYFLWRYKSRTARGVGIVAIAAAYPLLTYLVSLWAARGGWPEGMFYMMAVVFIVPPMMVGLVICLILTIFGDTASRTRRVGMIVSFCLLILVIAALIFNRQIRVLRYAAEIDSPDPNRRSYAVLMLGGTGVRSAEPMIIKAARDEDPTVRKNALLALSTLDDPATLPVVREALSDEDAGVREMAVTTIVPLGRGSAEVVSDLKRMQNDPDPNVRAAAEAGLSLISDEQLPPGTAK